MVQDTFAASSPGVTIMQKRRTPQVFSLHLDAYRTTSQQKEFCALLLRVASHGSISTSVLVFSSAQALTDNPIYRTMLHSLLNMKLVLVCIDEVHLFVQFGLWFRSEFVRLKSVLFDHLRRGADSDKTLVPVLFMTATCDRDLLGQLEILTGLTFLVHNIFWPDVIGMQQRRQRISYMPSNRAMGTITPLITGLMRKQDGSQFIIYSNSRVRLESAHLRLLSSLDAVQPLCKRDVILITGPMSKEQRFHQTHLFLEYEPASDPTAYHPVGCTTTRALGSAGWDSSRITSVYSVDFPTDPLSIVQEKGRAGR